jgi:hypothetical protein
METTERRSFKLKPGVIIRTDNPLKYIHLCDEPKAVSAKLFTTQAPLKPSLFRRTNPYAKYALAVAVEEAARGGLQVRNIRYVAYDYDLPATTEQEAINA